MRWSTYQSRGKGAATKPSAIGVVFRKTNTGILVLVFGTGIPSSVPVAVFGTDTGCSTTTEGDRYRMRWGRLPRFNSSTLQGSDCGSVDNRRSDCQPQTIHRILGDGRPSLRLVSATQTRYSPDLTLCLYISCHNVASRIPSGKGVFRDVDAVSTRRRRQCHLCRNKALRAEEEPR